MAGNGLTAAMSIDSRDHLKALPDDLLLKILVLLPLIEVVRTCALSRRWRRFWMQAASLHVVDEELDGGGEPGRFARAVDGILNVYSNRLSRARCYFRISILWEENVDVGRLTSWVRRAAELFEGDFMLSVETMQNLPEDSESEEDESDSEEEGLKLEIFELPYFEFAEKIKLTLSDRFLCLALPKGAGVFASLTHLGLVRLRFADGAGTALGEVVSSRCPCLVSLVLRYVQGVTALMLHTASLTHLTLSCVHGLRLLDVMALKLRTMTVQRCFLISKGAALQISAPLLLKLEWADCCPERTQVGLTDHLRTLVVGEIPPVSWDQGLIDHSNFDMILGHFRRTQVLNLHLPIHPEMGGHRKLMEHIVLPDQYQDLNLFVEPDGHMFGMSMFLLLKRCIGLRMLHLKLSGRKRKVDTCLSSCIWDKSPNWANQKIMFSSLQEIVVSDFNGTSHEVDVVSFILKCAPSLQRIIIQVADGVILSEETALHFCQYRQLKWRGPLIIQI